MSSDRVWLGLGTQTLFFRLIPLNPWQTCTFLNYLPCSDSVSNLNKKLFLLNTLLNIFHVPFQGPTRFGWGSEEGARSDSSPHLLRWSVKCPVTFLGGDPTLRDSWTESFGPTTVSPPLRGIRWAPTSWLTKTKKKILLSSPLLTISVFSPLKPSFRREGGCLSDLLSPPLDALLGHVEEPSCPSVHGFP